MRIASRRTTQEEPSPPNPSESPETLAQGEPRSSIDQFGWWLVLICAVGFILRLVIVYQGRHDALSGDGLQYSFQANLNARGEWFVNVYGPKNPSQMPSIRPFGRYSSQFGHGWANTLGSQNRFSPHSSEPSPLGPSV